MSYEDNKDGIDLTFELYNALELTHKSVYNAVLRKFKGSVENAQKL
jgi:hypothetical protein